ncbi:hypothetical protein OPT61_g1385 [Boeremia exigua]|uniref:Uncharacterized protein n=1 Tax=Boeremia exigua TaxID=749465 RepID=A0ACC2IQG4_9PLEO|nr:hypothetical protein OPT61_g1385 [Boeremia exigua]
MRKLKEAQKRIAWLQDEIYKVWGLECASLPTGTPLGTRNPRTSRNEGSFRPNDAVESSPSDEMFAQHAPEASLLALNASGELRYLGASSGALFASCAAALVRSSTTDRQPRQQLQSQEARESAPLPTSALDTPLSINQDEIDLLLKSYEMWIHPLYPLFDLDSLRSLVTRYRNQLTNGFSCTTVLSTEQHVEMTIVYVLMALGATNRSNTIKQLQKDHRELSDAAASTQASLFATSLKPVGASQWQLAGLAMRMTIELGLHHEHKLWYPSEQQLDQRRRVFWTAYAIEVTLAYNLGRPPSISHEHITTDLPKETYDVQSGIIHIKHRQIQGKIISQMYRASSQEHVPWEDQQRMIAELQGRLEDWRTSIPAAHGDLSSSPYPLSYWHRLYHSTTFVLHRKGPLCPLPSPDSLTLCIRSAGAYLDAIYQILRSSNVPESWMLIQGVLSAGLTMLISVRANFKSLDWSLILVDVPAWSRKCSVCLAIMRERWKEDLLSELEDHIEILTDNTLKFITNGLAAEKARSGSQDLSTDGSMHSQHPIVANELLGQPVELSTCVSATDAVPEVSDTHMATEWEPLGVFSEFLGVDFMDSYWDLQGIDNIFASGYENADVERQDAEAFET